MARCVAELEKGTAEAARWARTARIVEPDASLAEPVSARYARFRALTDSL
jgi:xylulokinase